MEYKIKSSPCTQPMYGEPPNCSTTSSGKKSYILTQKATDYSCYSPIGPLITDAVAIGYSADYQIPMDAVLCNHSAADLQSLNNGTVFQPDAISLSEASMCSSMETWTPDINGTTCSSDTQSGEILAQSHSVTTKAGTPFCYNNGIESCTLTNNNNNNNNQFYPQESNNKPTAASQQWDNLSSLTTPYTYFLQQQPKRVDCSNIMWIQNISPMMMSQTMPYAQTAIANQLQYDSTCIKQVSQEPYTIEMRLTSSSNMNSICPKDQVVMQQQELSVDEVNSNPSQEKYMSSDQCKNNRRHTVSLPFINYDSCLNIKDKNSEKDERRQSMDDLNPEQISFGHLTREELIQRVVELEKEKEYSKISVSTTEKQSSYAQTNSILSPDGSDEEEVHSCLWANCGLTASSLDQLIEHIRDIHIGSGKAAYYCEWSSCPRNQKPFMKRHKMQNHMRTHTGERPFVCNIEGCEKRFSRPDSLNTHIKTHSSIRPYICPVKGCGKAYFHSRSLRKHSKSHETSSLASPISGTEDYRSCYPYERSMKPSRYQNQPPHQHQYYNNSELSQQSDSHFVTPHSIHYTQQQRQTSDFNQHSQHHYPVVVAAAGSADTINCQSNQHSHSIEHAFVPSGPHISSQQYNF